MSIPWRRAPCNIKQSNFAPLHDSARKGMVEEILMG